MTDEQKAVERQNLIDILDRNFGYTDDEPAHVVADRLIAAGYRKQADVAREFAEKAINSLNKYCYIPRQVAFDVGFILGIKQAQATLMELAEQYGKED